MSTAEHSFNTIGLIGVGLMGHGIARNVLRRFPLVFLEHPGNQPTDDLVEAGAQVRQTPAEVARDADLVIVCVTGTPQVEAVFADSGGLDEALRDDLVIVDCSTAIPSSTVAITERVQAAGGHYLDAAMTRTPKEAAAGRLNLLIGGRQAVLECCRPVLECFAENLTHAGPVGSGHRLKLIHNFVSLGFAAITSEAVSCARRADMDIDTLIDVLAAGGGGSVVLDRLAPAIRDGDGSGFQFALANALKDMRYYATMAEQSGAVHPVADAIRDTYGRSVDARSDGTVAELADILHLQS